MSPRFLMCTPDFFEVSYEINPWMQGNIQATTLSKARVQWQALFDLVRQFAQVELLPPQPNQPDLVFTANAGTVLGKRVLLSRFRHPERQGEEPHFLSWFEQNGFRVMLPPPGVYFEGAGDALLDRGEARLWFGHGHRSVLQAQFYLEVISLRLSDPRFYHLDTCFCPLEGGFVMYYPQAFDPISQKTIQERLPVEKRLVIGEEDALDFACNAVNIGHRILLNRATPGLLETLTALGFEVFQTELSEFMKAGGSAKCLSLRLDEP